jgi:hypothetical protein
MKNKGDQMSIEITELAVFTGDERIATIGYGGGIWKLDIDKTSITSKEAEAIAEALRFVENNMNKDDVIPISKFKGIDDIPWLDNK